MFHLTAHDMITVVNAAADVLHNPIVQDCGDNVLKGAEVEIGKQVIAGLASKLMMKIDSTKLINKLFRRDSSQKIDSSKNVNLQDISEKYLESQLSSLEKVDPESIKLLAESIQEIKKLTEELKGALNEYSITQNHSGSGSNINMHASGSGTNTIIGVQNICHASEDGSKKKPLRGKEFGLPQPNQFFTGRDSILESLSEGFSLNNSQTAWQACSGMGGVGKTSICIQYAYKNFDKYLFVAFLKASTSDTLNNSLLELAEHLCLPGESPVQKRQSLRTWFSQEDKWLLIVDNVDEPKALSDLKEFIPGLSLGNVLFSTRMAHPVGLPSQSIKYPGMFSEQEGLQFLKSRLNEPMPDDQWLELAIEIVNEVGGMPLALEQAAAFIDCTSFSLSQFLEAYKVERIKLLTEKKDYAVIDDPETKHIAVTWRMNLQAVQQKDSKLEKMLKACALLSPETIPFELIMDGFSTSDPNYGQLTDEGSVKRFLAPLHDYSLIQLESNGFRLHKLMQEVIKSDFSQQKHMELKRFCVSAIYHTIPQQEEEYYLWSRNYLAHCIHFSLDDNIPDDSDTARLFRIAGYFSSLKADWNTATVLLNRALEFFFKYQQNFVGELAETYKALALTERGQGNFVKAEQYSQEMFKLNIQDPSSKWSDQYHQALNLKDVGSADLGNIDRSLLLKSKDLFSSLLPDCIKFNGKDSLATARIYNGLGHVYDLLEQNWRARIISLAALKIRQAHLPPNHPDIATQLSNLGYIFYKSGQDREANKMFRQAVSIWKKNFGLIHPHLATIYGHIGCLYERRGQLLIAEVFFYHSLEIYKKSVPENHPQISNATMRLRNLRNNLHGRRMAKALMANLPEDIDPRSVVFVHF